MHTKRSQTLKILNDRYMRHRLRSTASIERKTLYLQHLNEFRNHLQLFVSSLCGGKEKIISEFLTLFLFMLSLLCFSSSMYVINFKPIRRYFGSIVIYLCFLAITERAPDYRGGLFYFIFYLFFCFYQKLLEIFMFHIRLQCTVIINMTWFYDCTINYYINHYVQLKYFLKKSNHGHNMLGPFMIDQISLSPRMKKSAIVSNQHGIYAFSHKLPEDLRFRTKRNKKI